MTDFFLIYDMSRGLYWRANSCGYTAHTYDAGRYSKEECDDIAGSLDRTLRIEPAPTPSQSDLGDALALVEHLKSRLSETEQQRDFQSGARQPPHRRSCTKPQRGRGKVVSTEFDDAYLKANRERIDVLEQRFREPERHPKRARRERCNDSPTPPVAATDNEGGEQS